MSAYLFHRIPINFHFQLRGKYEGGEYSVVGDTEVAVSPQDPRSSEGDNGQNWSVMSRLKDLLNIKTRDGEKKCLKISFSYLITPELRCTDSLPPELYVEIKGKFLQQVRDWLGAEIRIMLEIELAQTANNGTLELNGHVPGELCKTPEMRVVSNTFGSRPTIRICSGTGPMATPGGWMIRWQNWFPTYTPSGPVYTAEASLLVSVIRPLSPSGDHTPGSSSTPHVFLANKRLLQEEIRSDVEIVAGNGIAVKCHSAHLAVHSQVLKTMMDSDLEESRTNKIPMPDVSEEVVRAFLAYLYYQDLSKPLESCSVAIDLLRMSHKYTVVCLETAIKSILLEKPNNWFDVSATLRLFFFVRKFDNQQDLRMKATQVLKSKPSEVLASAEYQRLCQVKDDSNCFELRTQFQAVQELFNAFLSTS